MTTSVELYIPFSGFYESVHDQLLDSELAAMFSDDQGEPSWEVVNRATRECNWGEVRLAYAKAYTEAFAEAQELPGLTFKELVSPREYNFSTDRILCEMSLPDFKAMARRVSPEAMDKVCTDELTPRSGFIPFYTPNWREWPKTLDANQRGLVVCALAGVGPASDFDTDAMEAYSCNGFLTRWIENAIPEVGKLYDLADQSRKMSA